MNREELNQFAMLKSVSRFFVENETLFADKPVIKSVHNQLEVMISDIQNHYQAQSASTKSATANKNLIKQRLTDNILKVAAAMGAYAVTVGDINLKMAADVTRYDLHQMREDDLVVKAKNIQQEANTVAHGLTEWGVTQEDIDQIDTYADILKTQTPMLRNIKVKSVQASESLRTTLTDALLHVNEKIDTLMLPYKTLNPMLYGQYRIVRTIVYRPASHSNKKSTNDTTPTADK